MKDRLEEKTNSASFGPLFNVGWRYLLARRWQSMLMVLGIALGVAVVVSIDLANASAGRAFLLSTETITGKTTHQVVEDANGIDEQVYTRMRRDGVINFAAPVVIETVSSPELGSRPMQLMGIDPFNDAPFRNFLGQSGNGSVQNLEGLSVFLTRPGAVILSQPVANRYNIQPGDPITLSVGGYRREALVVGLLVPQDSLGERTLDGIILADISTAQELTNRVGRLDRIDLLLPQAGASAVEQLERWLPQEYRIVPATARSDAIQQMTESFQLNLTALSLLALVVGLFLIYNTMTFSVVQRRGLFGTLRCLGVTRREVFGMVLGEALVVGLVGGMLGIGLGIVFGQLTVRMVTQTVNDLYFTTTVQSVGIPLQSLVKGGLLGVLATIFTAALPAWEAASIPPRAALLRSGLEAKARRATGKIGLAGALMVAASAGLFLTPGSSVVIGFTGTLLVVVGFALLSSACLVGLMRAIVPLTGMLFGLTGRMAPRNLINSLSRTAVAVAALMVAVAVIIGVALMIDSFRYTVVVWLEETLQGDVYVSVPGFNATRSSAVIDPQAVQVIRAWPGVSRVDTLRSVQVESTAGTVNLAATENPRIGEERQFRSLEGDRSAVWEKMSAGGVLVSEPLANRLDLTGSIGEMQLFTPQGWESFPVIGIFYDYASSEGTVMMALDVYQRLWKDNTLTALALRLEPGIRADAISMDLQDRLAGQQNLLIRPNEALRAEVLEVFDRTFAITVALRILAIGVAFIGVLNALLMLLLEKQREIGILRALGLTGLQLWRLVMIETGLMGLAAGLFSIPTGYALGLILIYVINRRSFGWTLQMSVHPETFFQALAVALAAALLAGVYPAWKMSTMQAAEVIRNE